MTKSTLHLPSSDSVEYLHETTLQLIQTSGHDDFDALGTHNVGVFRVYAREDPDGHAKVGTSATLLYKNLLTEISGRSEVWCGLAVFGLTTNGHLIVQAFEFGLGYFGYITENVPGFSGILKVLDMVPYIACDIVGKKGAGHLLLRSMLAVVLRL
jgi:hypothetical protein